MDEREQDSTPEGDPIDTRTIWLDFGDEGECGISIDLTAWNAAMKRAATWKPDGRH